MPVAATAALMIAYWATQAMSTNEARIVRQRAGLRKAAGLILLAALATVILLAAAYLVAPRPPGYEAWLGRTFLTAIGMGLVIAVTGAALAWSIARAIDDGSA